MRVIVAELSFFGDFFILRVWIQCVNRAEVHQLTYRLLEAGCGNVSWAANIDFLDSSSQISLNRYYRGTMKTTSTPRKQWFNSSGLQTSPLNISTSRPSIPAVLERIRARTVCPRANRVRIKLPPSKPAPPVTAIFTVQPIEYDERDHVLDESTSGWVCGPPWIGVFCVLRYRSEPNRQVPVGQTSCFHRYA